MYQSSLKCLLELWSNAPFFHCCVNLWVAPPQFFNNVNPRTGCHLSLFFTTCSPPLCGPVPTLAMRLVYSHLKCQVEFSPSHGSRERQGIQVISVSRMSPWMTYTPITHLFRTATISHVPLHRPSKVDKFLKGMIGQPTLRVSFETGRPEILIWLWNLTGTSSDSLSCMMAESADW